MYSINTNLSADGAARALSKNDSNLNVFMQQLATGVKAVNAETADGALASSFGSQSNGLGQAIKNANIGQNFLNVMSAALKEQKEILQKMKVLTTQAQTAGYTNSDRAEMDSTVTQLVSELNRNAESARFNGASLIDGGTSAVLTGSAGDDLSGGFDNTGGTQAAFSVSVDGAAAQSVTLASNDYTGDSAGMLANINSQITGATASLDDAGKLVITSDSRGASASVEITANTANVGGDATDLFGGTVATVNGVNNTGASFHVGFDTSSQNDITAAGSDMTSSGLGVSAISVTSVANAKTADNAVDTAMSAVSSTTSSFRAIATRLSFTAENLGAIKQNTDKALSAEVDTDYASATTSLAKAKVLQQAASAMLTQANTAPQQALQLLKG